MTPPDTSANAAPAEAPLEALSPQALRGALGRFATGVTLITCRDADGAPVGLTANSFTSLSLDPPLVLWSLRRASASLPAFTAAPHFAVNHVLCSGRVLRLAELAVAPLLFQGGHYRMLGEIL
ncbi:MAG: hypothetical protein CFE45_24270 [Burkholderiales bacterium PBB5]|nr:MAG: hypothetical protein CFE45_24270 [Burkholderiales bacterium PBB5]